jgi:hypothetical protein
MCGNKTSWVIKAFSEAGSGVVRQILGKPGIRKGGQTVIISNIDRIQPRFYIIHQHKMHKYPYPQKGPIEVRIIYENLEFLGNVPDIFSCPTILHAKLHMTWNNFFSGESIIAYAARKKIILTMTCHHDRWPHGVPSKYWHKEKTDDSKACTQAARYEQPIFAIKHYQQLHYPAYLNPVHFLLQGIEGTQIVCYWKGKKGRGNQK